MFVGWTSDKYHVFGVHHLQFSQYSTISYYLIGSFQISGSFDLKYRKSCICPILFVAVILIYDQLLSFVFGSRITIIFDFRGSNSINILFHFDLREFNSIGH